MPIRVGKAIEVEIILEEDTFNPFIRNYHIINIINNIYEWKKIRQVKTIIGKPRFSVHAFA